MDEYDEKMKAEEKESRCNQSKNKKNKDSMYSSNHSPRGRIWNKVILLKQIKAGLNSVFILLDELPHQS